MYQPELGRFLQPDPKEFEAGDYNLYRYCHNDPVNKSDPTGLREQIAGDIHRDIMWDMARYADSSNNEQGSFADFTHKAYMGKGGAGRLDGSRGYAMGQVSQAGPIQRESDPNAPDSMTRTNSSYVEEHRGKKGEFITNIVIIRWTYLVQDASGKPMPGVYVKEDIQRSDPKCFAPKGEKRSNFWTKPNGTVIDTWSYPFKCPDGHVTVSQTLTVMGRQLTWKATVNADGELTKTEHWVPFQ